MASPALRPLMEEAEEEEEEEEEGEEEKEEEEGEGEEEEEREEVKEEDQQLPSASPPADSSSDISLLFSAIARDSQRFLRFLLSDPSVDINCRRFGETPLLCAIRWRRAEVALSLLERGADPNVKKILLEAGTTARGAFNWYEVTARQLAYEAGLTSVVRAIDAINGQLFPFLRPPALRREAAQERQGMFSEVVDVPADFFEPCSHRSGGRYALSANRCLSSRRARRKKEEEERKEREMSVRFDYDRVLSALSRHRLNSGSQQSVRAASSISCTSSSSSSFSSASVAASSVVRDTKSSRLRRQAVRKEAESEGGGRAELRRRKTERIGLRDALFGACLDTK